MKLLVLVFIILCLILSCFIYFSQDNSNTIESNCKDFNGKAFLLSGGSKKPVTFEEINNEYIRLNWLCSGSNS